MLDVHAVVLSAGSSSRLGRPKQLVQLGGQSLLRRAVEIARGADVASVTVVLGASADALLPELEGLAVRIARNEDWRAGMGTSLRCGARSIDRADLHGLLFMVCDQLHLTSGHLDRMIAAFRSGPAPIIASAYAGTLGVPTLFSSAFRGELLELSGARGGKQLLERHADEVLAVPLPGGEHDLDTEDDLKEALSR